MDSEGGADQQGATGRAEGCGAGWRLPRAQETSGGRTRRPLGFRLSLHLCHSAQARKSCGQSRTLARDPAVPLLCRARGSHTQQDLSRPARLRHSARARPPPVREPRVCHQLSPHLHPVPKMAGPLPISAPPGAPGAELGTGRVRCAWPDSSPLTLRADGVCGEQGGVVLELVSLAVWLEARRREGPLPPAGAGEGERVPWALSGPDASSGRQGDKSRRRAAGQRWRRARSHPQPPGPGASSRPWGAAQTSLRAGLCAPIAQVRGRTGPWPAQPATTCEGCRPVCPAPRPPPRINGARSRRRQTAPPARPAPLDSPAPRTSPEAGPGRLEARTAGPRLPAAAPALASQEPRPDGRPLPRSTQPLVVPFSYAYTSLRVWPKEV